MHVSMKRIIYLLLFLLIPQTLYAKEKLHLVTSLDPIEANEYIMKFEKDTGIDVEWIRLSAGEVVARLKAEGKNQSQSVWFGGPIPEYVAAKKEGFLTPYRPKDANRLPEKWIDEKGYFTGIYFGSIVFISNKNFLKMNDLSPPKSWYDLLDKKWDERIVIAYPYTAGTGYTILAGLISLMGEDHAYSYWKKLDKNIHHYTKSGASPIIEVGLGEAAVGVVFAQDAVRKGTSRGFPLIISYPKEGTPYEVGGVALLKNAPEVKNAKIFIDWIISLKGQNHFSEWGRIPIHPDAKVPEDVKKPSEINTIDMDMVKMGKERSKYVTKWRQELKQ